MASPIDRKSMKPPMSKLFVLEEDFYPDTWNDDGKMSVMLNNFRPRDVNQEHYDQKMRFWRDMIENYCEYKGSSQCSIQELKRTFTRKGTQPYCLQEVINHMIADGSVTNKDEFMKQPKSLAGWAVDSLLVKPLSWGFGKIKEKLISNAVDEGSQFVVKCAVRNQSAVIHDHIRALNVNNNIISMDDLMAEEIDGVVSDGILLALHHLNTEKKVYIEEANEPTEHHHKLLLKFAGHHDNVTPITDMERSVYNLEKTEKFLLHNIENKEKELDRVLKQVKDCLKDGKKTTAKTFLRKKHLLENDLTKSFNVLDNVQAMLQRVHASKNDNDIINTYKMGSDALKKSFADAGLNLDNVHDVIEDMQELFDKQEEFESAISEPIRGTRGIDDADLEKELMELMRSEEADDDQKNNAGGSTKDKKPVPESDPVDLELERRLRLLRTNTEELNVQEGPKEPRSVRL